MAKKVSKVYTTGKVTLAYPNIDRPDKKYGNYKADLFIQDKEELRELKDTTIKMAMEADFEGSNEKLEWGPAKRGSKSERLFYGNTMLPFGRDEEGKIYVATKSKYAPAVYDAYGDQYEEEALPAIGGGTTAKVRIVLLCTKSGSEQYVSAKLSEVQILGLRTYGGQNEGFGDASDEVSEDEKILRASDAKRRPRFEDGAEDGDDADDSGPDDISETDEADLGF